MVDLSLVRRGVTTDRCSRCALACSRELGRELVSDRGDRQALERASAWNVVSARRERTSVCVRVRERLRESGVRWRAC